MDHLAPVIDPSATLNQRTAFQQSDDNCGKPHKEEQGHHSLGWCMDRLGSMAVFVKVVECSSFAAAARHFRMSPAMVSKHVQALEERIGARLLNRTTRRVSPTEVGQGYYERCLHILADFEEAEREAG